MMKLVKTLVAASIALLSANAAASMSCPGYVDRVELLDTQRVRINFDTGTNNSSINLCDLDGDGGVPAEMCSAWVEQALFAHRNNESVSLTYVGASDFDCDTIPHFFQQPALRPSGLTIDAN